MKLNKIYITAGLTALVAFTSCKKIDLFPTNAIEVSQSFKTIKDAATWDDGLYAGFRGTQYGSFMFYPDVQGDQLNAGLDYGNRNGAPGRWDGTFTADDQTLGPIWAAYYKALANVNIAIAGYPTIPGVTSAADVASLNQYTGDAYLFRAYYYHRLILRWGKPYTPATAATDLGVPLVLTYDLNGHPARATVGAVYAQIIADITKAETALAGVPGVVGSKTFTIDAAKALEARVRLDMQDWTGAYNAANSLITPHKYALITTQAAFTAYWATDGTQESIMQINATSTTEAPNVNNIYLGFRAADSKYDPDFFPSLWVVNMFATGDIRKLAYFAQFPVIVQGINYANIWCVNKYPGNPALFTAATTNYFQAPKVFRIGEIYCIAAEAANNASNTTGAVSALNELRAARGAALSAGGPLLTQDIRDERFRELAFEGYRLNDLARWHLGFTRNTPQNTNMLVGGTQYYTLSIPADAPKFVWGIPSNDILINTNLVQNPGW